MYSTNKKNCTIIWIEEIVLISYAIQIHLKLVNQLLRMSLKLEGACIKIGGQQHRVF